MHSLLQTCHRQIMSLALGICPPAELLQVGLAASMRITLLQDRHELIKQLAEGDSEVLKAEGRCWDRSLCCLKHEVSALLSRAVI